MTLNEFAMATLDQSEVNVLLDRLEEGKQANGENFPEYSPVTIGIKRGNGGFISQSGNIALKDTGTFHSSVKLDINSKFAEATSDAHIASKLFEIFGGDILDFSKDEVLEIFEEKRPLIVEQLKNYLK